MSLCSINMQTRRTFKGYVGCRFFACLKFVLLNLTDVPMTMQKCNKDNGNGQKRNTEKDV